MVREGRPRRLASGSVRGPRSGRRARPASSKKRDQPGCIGLVGGGSARFGDGQQNEQIGAFRGRSSGNEQDHDRLRAARNRYVSQAGGRGNQADHLVEITVVKDADLPGGIRGAGIGQGRQDQDEGDDSEDDACPWSHREPTYYQRVRLSRIEKQLLRIGKMRDLLARSGKSGGRLRLPGLSDEGDEAGGASHGRWGRSRRPSLCPAALLDEGQRARPSLDAGGCPAGAIEASICVIRICRAPVQLVGRVSWIARHAARIATGARRWPALA